jgi:hypothetical protein
MQIDRTQSNLELSVRARKASKLNELGRDTGIQATYNRAGIFFSLL